MISFIKRVFRRIRWQFYLIGVSNTSGRMIRKMYKNRIPMKNGLIIDTSNPQITNRTAATIYLNAYEKNELLAIATFLNPANPTIELGSSIGVTGVCIARRSTQPVYCIEANPELVGSITRQFELNGLPAPKVRNVAVSTSTGPLYMRRSLSSDSGTVGSPAGGDSVAVPCISLSRLVAEERIGDFNLVCDIEGSELDLLVNDARGLANCRVLIIELHRTVFDGREYQLEDIAKIIEGLGFRLMQRSEEVFAFRK
jgi:FkbM family methyltransferase